MAVFSEFASRLKLLRKRKSLTQATMAEHLGVTERHYRLYEAGKVDPPTSKIIKLRDFFCVSADYILGLSSDAESIDYLEGQSSNSVFKTPGEVLAAIESSALKFADWATRTTRTAQTGSDAAQVTQEELELLDKIRALPPDKRKVLDVLVE